MSMMLGRHKLASLSALALLAGLLLPAWAAPRYDPKEERKIGESVCAEVDKEFKRLDDKEVFKRVQGVVGAIVPNTQRPDIVYDIRLIDTPEINAFSIPGGFIYVTKGLLGAVQSDDELAGVLAHEIAHNCHYDALVQANRSRKLFLGALGAAVAALILGARSDVIATAAQAGLYVRQGILSHYSIDIEANADADAVKYMCKTSLNPVGLLTFMERLARTDRLKMTPDPGIFQDHPESSQRVVMLMDELTAAGVRINRRATSTWRQPEVKDVKLDGREAPSPAVLWWDQTIFAVLDPDAAKAKARADDLAKQLTAALARGATVSDFTIDRGASGVALLAFGQPLLIVTPDDATARGKDAADVASDVLHALRRALMRERLAYQF
jgi:Zn-dependent protease with chaperone function